MELKWRKHERSNFKFLTWDSPIAQKHGSTYPTYQKVWKMDQISETCSTLETQLLAGFLNVWLNNCERKLLFSTVSYEVIVGYKCSSEFTFEQEKQFFVNISFSFHSMIK